VVEGRAVGEWVVSLTGPDGDRIGLPVAVAVEPAADLPVRIYHSQWPLLGHHVVRPPLLEHDPAAHASDVGGGNDAHDALRVVGHARGPRAISITPPAAPTTAIRKSAPGVRGSDRSCETPPNSHRVIPSTSIPLRRATAGASRSLDLWAGRYIVASSSRASSPSLSRGRTTTTVQRA